MLYFIFIVAVSSELCFCRYFCACACYGICLFQYYRVLGFFAACNLLAFHVHISAAFEHVLQSGSQLKSFMILRLQQGYKLKVCLLRCVKNTPAYFPGTNTLVLSASFGRNTLDITMGFFGQCIFNEEKIRRVFFYTSQ